MTSGTAIIPTVHLFPELDGQLLELFRSLTTEEWRAPTIVPRWHVHQIAVHLLDTALRRLSLCRDGWSVSHHPIRTEQDLIDLVNRQNAQGVEVLGRLSPAMLISLTQATVPQLSAYLSSLEPMGPAPFAVSWAGESSSANWFDIAREYTERWHHQQQIRLAVGRPGIVTPRLYRPVLETFMRALPRAYAGVDADHGTVCRIVVPGKCGSVWHVAQRDGAWTLEALPDESVAAVASTTVIPDDLAWRLFTNGLSEGEAASRITIHGDRRLGAVVLRARAIVA